MRSADPFRAFYDRALPEVYSYLRARLPSDAAALRATRRTFMALTAQWPFPPESADRVGLAMGLARRELVAELRLGGDAARPAGLTADQWAALILGHVDGLPVGAVARVLGRRVRATAALLARAERTSTRPLEAADA